MYENGLGNVLSGVETAPGAPEEGDTQLQITPYAKKSRIALRGEKRKALTRMLLATVDSQEWYGNVAAQVVLA